jgi:hypothetical protein
VLKIVIFCKMQELRELLTIFVELVRAVRNQTKSPELHAVLARSQSTSSILLTMD